MITSVSGTDAQTLRGTANPKLNITTAVPGSEPTPAVNTGSTVRYQGLAYLSKITVRTVCPNQLFDLTVDATGATSGHGSHIAVTLLNGMLAADCITSIPISASQIDATLTYTASAQFSDGTGTDTHTVTYTQVAQ